MPQKKRHSLFKKNEQTHLGRVADRFSDDNPYIHFLRKCKYNSFPDLKKKIAFEIYRRKLRFSAREVIGIASLRKLISDDLNADRICHILGSGASLNISEKKIAPADFVIGINFSGVSSIHSDIYITEVSTKKTCLQEEKTGILKKCIANSVFPKGGIVLYKNLWSGYLDKDTVAALAYSRKYILKDIFYSRYGKECKSEKDLREFCDKLYRNSRGSDYLYQYGSSVCGALDLAVRLGFRNIVLHGQDFGGPHFYNVESYKWPSWLTDREIMLLKEQAIDRNTYRFYQHTEEKFRYVVELIKMKQELKIFSGCKESKVAEYLDVYEASDNY